MGLKSIKANITHKGKLLKTNLWLKRQLDSNKFKMVTFGTTTLITQIIVQAIQWYISDSLGGV